MIFHVVINGVELDLDFNTFEENITEMETINQELILSFQFNSKASILKEADLTQVQPFLREDSISELVIVDEQKNEVFSSTTYHKIMTASKIGNGSGNPVSYTLMVRFGA